MNLCVVTATTDPARALACIQSWGFVEQIFVVVNGRGSWEVVEFQAKATTAQLQTKIRWIAAEDYLGSVAAFALGVNAALDAGFQLIACFHDDLELRDPEWVEKVRKAFARMPRCGLLGFGGAIGLGSDDIYQVPYEPMQLARVGFRSNLVDAEAHGLRSLLPERVACLDGFSQIGRAEFWKGQTGGAPVLSELINMDRLLDGTLANNALQHLHNLGMRHHAYDSALGLLAARWNWEVWYLPIRCLHYGGRTAVGDAGYQQWAQAQNGGRGDGGFWEDAHQALWTLGKGTLPIRL